jgi:hypothetical protein
MTAFRSSNERNLEQEVPRRGANPAPKTKWYEKTGYQLLLFVGGALVYLLLGVVLWWVLDQYINPQSSTQKKDLIQALGLIMAGLAGIVGVFFTWRSLLMTQRNLQDTIEIAQEQLHLAEEGQVTERFAKGIDQLGEEDDKEEPRIEIRIGGISALERIAIHSPTEYAPIMEILAAYIRENTKWDYDESVLPTLQWYEVTTSSRATLYATGVRGDVQAALDVLGRRQREIIPERHRPSLNLHRSNLIGANLIGANLSGADLSRANLSRAYLQKANLSGASMEEADLSGAVLTGANLSGAILANAHLEGATLATDMLTGQEFQRIRRLVETGQEDAVDGVTIQTYSQTLRSIAVAILGGIRRR